MVLMMVLSWVQFCKHALVHQCTIGTAAQIAQVVLGGSSMLMAKVETAFEVKESGKTQRKNENDYLVKICIHLLIALFGVLILDDSSYSNKLRPIKTRPKNQVQEMYWTK